MAQPFNRMAQVPAPREIDPNLGEFWVESPWQIAAQGHNLSAYERKRAFLNSNGRAFFDISGLTGADSDGDGRSVVVFDVDGDGRQDILLRQSGGGPLLLFENRFPTKHWLEVSLRGIRSNRLGIGSRVVARIGDRVLTRELYPPNTFNAQGLTEVHFGLGDATGVDELTVSWPSGVVQKLHSVRGDRRLVVTEGGGAG